jgi:uncharacterized protein
MQRRSFLKLALAGGALGALPAAAVSRQSPLLLAGCDTNNQHTLCGWQLEKGELFRLRVDQRVHAPLLRPATDEAIFVARRPGTVTYVVDIREGMIKQQFNAVVGRHFYGHATFSVDGRWLFVPENAFADGGRGVIGVYDAVAGYQRVNEFDLGGVGPHQLALMPDGVTLAVALGGIQTHPDRGREKLNLDTMQSALLYVDSSSGEIIDKINAPHRHLSLRHLNVTSDGTVVLGAQFQTGVDKAYKEASYSKVVYKGPMVFSHQLTGQHRGSLQSFNADSETWLAQHHYIASVAVNHSGSRVLTTSPRGGVVNLWDVKQGEMLQQFRVRDVAGADYLSAQQGFVVSNGLGQLFRVAQTLEFIAKAPFTRWDNHLVLHV